MTLLGLAAGLLTTMSFLPQVVRTFRTGSAAALSWTWLLAFGGGVTGWILYGALTRDLAVIASNCVLLAFVLSLVVLRIRAVDRASDGIAGSA